MPVVWWGRHADCEDALSTAAQDGKPQNSIEAVALLGATQLSNALSGLLFQGRDRAVAGRKGPGTGTVAAAGPWVT